MAQATRPLPPPFSISGKLTVYHPGSHEEKPARGTLCGQPGAGEEEERGGQSIKTSKKSYGLPTTGGGMAGQDGGVEGPDATGVGRSAGDTSQGAEGDRLLPFSSKKFPRETSLSTHIA